MTLLYTDQVSRIIQYAGQIARRLGKIEVGTEHLLWGMAKEGSGISGAIFKIANIDLRIIVLRVEAISDGCEAVVDGPLRDSPAAQTSLLVAKTMASLDGSESISDAYLLLSLLGDIDNVAAQILCKLGLTLQMAASLLDEIQPRKTRCATEGSTPLYRAMRRRQDRQSAARWAMNMDMERRATKTRGDAVTIPRELLANMTVLLEMCHNLLRKKTGE